MSDRGWDNSNYLNALGSGQQSIDEANASYQQEAEARSIHQDKKFQAMAHDERFEQFLNQEQEDEDLANEMSQRNTMLAAQTPPSMPQAPPPPPQQQQPMQGIPQMTPQDYYQALQAWQQAMVAFQQFSAANPQAAAQMTPPPPPPPPPVFTPEAAAGAASAVGTVPPPPPPPQTQQQPVVQQQQSPPDTSSNDNNNNNNDNSNSLQQYLPKRAGGNNDAYEVNNSADVYFAQLKRDSSIRTEARRRGDLDTANAPFTEKGVLALKNFLSDELVSQRRERLKHNGGEFETSRDEMILPQHFEGGEDDLDRAYTGVSYKEKLMQAKMIEEVNE